VSWARADLTQGNVYSISETTRSYLAQLQEPLLIRGYFSAQTHPLLAPLVPRLRDLMQEYAVAGDGQVRVEFIDPQEHPELEQEANEIYDIQPVPFQFASKYQATVVNSYFNILIQYGDQHQVLGFSDLIEVKMQSEADLEVELRNPEYDITQSIKKILYAYQGSGELFDNIPHPVSFKGYISNDEKLPEVLKILRKELGALLNDLAERSGGTLTIDIRDPDAAGGILASQIKSDFGFRPMAASLLDTNTFWFYMTLEGDGRIIQVPLPEQYDKAGLESGMQAALKRFSRGFLKTVALHTPVFTPGIFGMPATGKRFDQLRAALAETYNLASANMQSGRIPDDADLLLLVSPDKLGIRQLFAVDQFLMRGGTVIVATSPYDIDIQDRLTAKKNDSVLMTWLAHHGIVLEEQLVLDPQNASFPIPVERRVGDHVFRETRMLSYPYFGDIRGDGIVQSGGLTTGIDQVTMTWPSPISLDEHMNQDRKVARVLESSNQAWTSESMEIEPDFEMYGELGFAVDNQGGAQLLAVSVEGRFESYFKDKPSPLLTFDAPADGKENAPVITRVIDRSPESARIIVFASGSFLTDTMLDLASSAMGTQYLKPIQLVENALDWSLEDRGLLAIRGRANFSRTLNPLDRESQLFWEYLNYGLPLFGLLLIGLIRRQTNKRAISRYAAILGTTENGRA
jgi:ABC-2 type transport system permease protein